MIDIAGADEIVQHGCDETGVSGVGLFSQWVLLKKNGSLKACLLLLVCLNKCLGSPPILVLVLDHRARMCRPPSW